MRRGTGCLIAIFVASVAFGGCWSCVWDFSKRVASPETICPCGEPLGRSPARGEEEQE